MKVAEAILASNVSTAARPVVVYAQGGGAEQPVASAPGRFEQWTRELAKIIDQLAEQDRTLYERLKWLLDMVRASHITITFGGHFSSGKSTILNAALDRSLLPVDELPETGVLCLLRSGAQDTAQVVGTSRCWSIECTSNAIQHVTSLISAQGERRTEVDRVDRLELTLKGVPIPDLATWIDSPGINDTYQMNERALRAALQGDMLIWVLSSRQPLSEAEIEFIARYITERGPRAVTFLLNAFLSEDTQQEWNQFLQKKLRIYRNKVNDHAARMGFTPQITPVILVIAGRALCKQRTDAFGGSELRRFLLSLTSGKIHTIQQTRLQHAEIVLHAIIKELQEKVQKKRTELAHAQEQLRQKQQDTQRRSAAFKRVIEECIHTFFTAWSTHIRSNGMTISNQITNQTLSHNHYQAINYGMSNITTAAVRILFGQMDRAIHKYNQAPLPPDARTALITHLAPPYVQVVAPASGGSGGALLGAAIGGSNGVDKAIQATRMNVQFATEQAIATYLSRQQKTISTVLTTCVVSNPSVQQLDNTILRRLEATLQSLTELAGEAALLVE